MVVDPLRTLVKLSLLCFLAGMGWAIFGALVIYWGSTRTEPRLKPHRIWAEWRRHRVLWALGVVIPVVGTYLSSDHLLRTIGLRDLYWWIAGRRDIVLIGKLGAASGYLLVTCLVTWLSWRQSHGKEAVERPRRRSPR
jgi:hypothetical protein